jgi:hypothetical protein
MIKSPKNIVMRTGIIFSLVLVCGFAARGGTVFRHEVDRGSELEKDLACTISVQEAPAPEFIVKFNATEAGRLKDLFELGLTLNDGSGMLLQVPLSIKSQPNKENEIAVQFSMKKSLIKQAVLSIRCGSGLHAEDSYAIRLKEYAPDYRPTEPERIAELRQRHLSDVGILSWHRSKKPSDHLNNPSALGAAGRLFAEANFIGLSRAGVTALLGPPDADSVSPPSSITYSYGNGEQFVIRRFHFDTKGEIERVEAVPSQ